MSLSSAQKEKEQWLLWLSQNVDPETLKLSQCISDQDLLRKQKAEQNVKFNLLPET